MQGVCGESAGQAPQAQHDQVQAEPQPAPARPVSRGTLLQNGSAIVVSDYSAWPLDRPVDAAFGAQKNYLHKLITECRAAVRNGTTLAKSVESIGLDENKNWLLFDDYHRRNVTAVYTELEWED